MEKIWTAAVIALAAVTAHAAARSETIPMTPDRWELAEAAFVQKDGRQALRLGSDPEQPRKGGGADVKGLQFATGVIEFDMLITSDRMEFTGPIFRQAEGGQGEFVYFRPHLNGKPDAIQYTPVVNNNLTWQIFTGPGFEAEIKFPIGTWTRVRADIYASAATISVDGKEALHIPELKTGITSGTVGVIALMGGTYYSNFKVEPIAGYRDPKPAPEMKPMPAGSVRTWKVTAALAETEAMDRAAKARWTGVDWHPIAVESNGIANLSKAGPDGEKEHSFIARFGLRTSAAKTVTMQFGFSDKVRVFLNGRPLYAGADLQGSRDYRFLGHVGFWDTLFLPLNAGPNEVVFVVTDDTNGGTAAAARLDPDPAVVIE